MNKNRILIVDDDRGILDGYREILTSRGYIIDTAESGAEALKKATEMVYDLVLLDIKLPDMEGTKLLTELPKTVPKMVKIMITGYANVDNASESVNSGADAFLMKPVDPEKLIKVIEEKLEEQRKSEEMNMEKMTELIRTRSKKLLQD